MPRMERRPQTTRSEHWLRKAIEDHRDALNTLVRKTLGLPSGEDIEWLSPLKSDGYAEYRDQSFLERLGIESTAVPLKRFWPPRGPQWDALARTSSQKYILVEAKAYLAEAVGQRTKATNPASTKLIQSSLQKAKTFFGAGAEADWNQPYYQYTNRLAHWYFLRQLCGLDAYLLFLNFADAPDVTQPSSREDWLRTSQDIQLYLDVDLTTQPAIGTLIWSVPMMLEMSHPINLVALLKKPGIVAKK